jgi:hypothetical protein
MDIDKLRNLSQEGQNNLEKKVLQFCNPQEVAKKLMRDLETEAAKQAKEGKHEAEVDFTIWYKRYTLDFDSGKTKVLGGGPLYSCDNAGELESILFGMVRKHVDDNIQLKLKADDDPPAEDQFSRCWSEGTFLVATLSW